MNDAYYAEELRWLRQKIVKKRREVDSRCSALANKKKITHTKKKKKQQQKKKQQKKKKQKKKNAPAHTSEVAMAAAS